MQQGLPFSFNVSYVPVTCSGLRHSVRLETRCMQYTTYAVHTRTFLRNGFVASHVLQQPRRISTQTKRKERQRHTRTRMLLTDLARPPLVTAVDAELAPCADARRLSLAHALSCSPESDEGVVDLCFEYPERREANAGGESSKVRGREPRT